jgi:predicted nucleotidyltransferase
MLLEQNSEIKLMQVLVKYWYKQFSAYELAREAKITAPMVYRALVKLSSKNVVTFVDGRAKISFNNHFAYTFKLLYDAERFLELKKTQQEVITRVFDVMRSEYAGDLQGFVIFGSVASGEDTLESDIDMLVIVNKIKEVDYDKRGLLRLGEINVIEKEKSEFEKEYSLGQELVLNSLMNGILLYDSWILRFMLMKPLPPPSLEAITSQYERVDLFKKRLWALLKHEDNDELVKQFKKYLIEKGRLMLLQKGVISSSKHDLSLKLKQLDKQAYFDLRIVNLKNVRGLVMKHA